MSEEVGFTLDMLMELAGQAIANVVVKLKDEKSISKVLVLVGPGNNGGDGLVCARHLKMMGFNVDIAMYKPTNNPLFKRLINTCRINEISFLNNLESLDINEQA
jgi:NAD(P)H-hydrate epimerase